MSSRKCYVCSRKSSSRWFKVSEALHEDVWECFNVKERVVFGDESLRASCRRNLTRWRESRPADGKYFKIANSRGKPFINNAPIARQNRKFALFSRNLSEIAPLNQLPEDVFWRLLPSWTFQISWGWDKHMLPRKPNLHVKLPMETVVETGFSRQKSSRWISSVKLFVGLQTFLLH